VEPVVYTPVSAAANLRRSVIISVVLGVVAVVILWAAGHPLAGLFGCVGLALAAVNNLMLQKSVIQYATAGVNKGKFRGGVMMRLGGITIISIIIALLFRPDGYATFAGLAVFHILMLVGAAVPVFRSLRPNS
jgi:cation transport ATPase